MLFEKAREWDMVGEHLDLPGTEARNVYEELGFILSQTLAFEKCIDRLPSKICMCQIS